MKKLFSFSGRITKSNFGLHCLVYIVFNGTFRAVAFNPSVGDSKLPLLFFILMIPMTWVFLAAGAKRCHDLGRNGFYQLIPFYSIVLLIKDGQLYPNEYGPNPEFPDLTDDKNDVNKHLIND